MFEITSTPISSMEMTEKLSNQEAGALVIFEGRVRDHNEGKGVSSLEYQIYEKLASKEGQRIIEEAKDKFNIHNAAATHRHGHLRIGETAVWIGATATHRDDAYKASRFIIDEIKYRLPVWKKEHYVNQNAKWVFCREHHNHVHFEESEYYQKQSSLINQEKLKRSKVLVIGAGGLGCPSLLSLASAGIGTIGIMDFDKVAISNIHRQYLYTPNDVGELKVDIAKKRLSELNPFIKIDALSERFDNDSYRVIENYHLILDCSDNLETKYLIHDACFKLKVPLISASLFKFEGQIRTFTPGESKGCLRCINQEAPSDSLIGNCNDFGVLSSVAGVVGSIQANEAISFLNDLANSTIEHTLYLNLKEITNTKIKNTKKDGCAYCEGLFELTSDSIEVSYAQAKEFSMSLIDIRELSDEEARQKISTGPVALYCNKGVRSKGLVKALREEGHSQVYSLKGGACSLSL